MSTAQTLSAFAADAPRYGSDPVNAYYQLNQTGQAQNVQSVNGLGGQVVIELNGTPIPATGQNINIVAGTGVLTVAAGGQSANGNVGLTSTDGSIVFTNPGGANANIDLSSIVPVSRVNAVLSNTGTGVNYLIIGGSGVQTSGPIEVFTITGLTSGKQYLLNIVINFGIYPGYTSSGATADYAQFQFDNTSGNTLPFLAPTSLGKALTFPLTQDYGTLTSAAPAAGASNFSILTQSTSAIIVAQGTQVTLRVNSSGQTTGPNITVNSSSFMQMVQLN